MKKKFFYASLIANVVLALVLFISYYALKNSNQAEILTANKKHHERRKELFEILPKQHREIVMLGDGLIEEANWAELIQNKKVRNRGIKGDMTPDVLRRVRDVAEPQPTQIYLYVGGEDIANGRSILEILQDYEKILTEIKLQSPGTQILAQSILPVNFGKGERLRNNTTIQAFNQKLEALCARVGAKYFDLYKHFLLDNQLNHNFTNDGVHLNAKGYKLWAKLINQNFPSNAILKG